MVKMNDISGINESKEGSADSLSSSPFFCDEVVKEKLKKVPYETNETLKRFIYIAHKSNINQFSNELGVSRQYIWGIINGRLRVSITMARKICDILNVEDTRLIFPDGSLDYPEIETFDKNGDGENGENN